MNKSSQIFSLLKKQRLIALLTPKNAEECLKAYEILHPFGIVLEIAFRSEYALPGIKAILQKYPDALVLAGTIMTRKQAESAITAGAAGIVSADYIPAVVDFCVSCDVMCIPGGLSDAGKQLAQKAELYNCDLEELKDKYPYQWIYKLFPAVAGDISNVPLAEAWKGPYKGLSVVYTGGVTLDNLPALYRQAPEGIFCASALTKDCDNAEKMTSEAEKWLRILNNPAGNAKTEHKAIHLKSGSKKRVVTFGEIMLRLSAPNQQRFIQAKNFDINFGGAEANTAVAFANYGMESTFVTALPTHEIGQAAVNSLRAYGVDTNWILRQGDRVGIYYLENGASQRASKVVYDRKGSSISHIQPGEIAWEKVLDKAGWFHWSGITPALGDNVKEALKEGLVIAKKLGVTVSVDLNYRKNLWDKEKAGKAMTELMQYVDICVGNEEDAECFFGLKAKSTNLDSGKVTGEEYLGIAEAIVQRFGCSKVAFTLRGSISASDNDWSACLYNGKEFLLSKSYRIHIVDRVGAGDSFTSGLIYGLLNGMSDKDALEFGTAASCLKQTIPGDFNLVSTDEVLKLASGVSSGRVQR